MIFRHHTGKPIEVIKCFGGVGPGHVWSSTDESLIDPDPDVERVVVALGSVPPVREFYEFRNCVTVFINEHSTPARFDRLCPAYVAPMSTNGWSLSHVAFRRLLDIETELSFDRSYSEMFDQPDRYARPLCLILAELFKTLHLTRAAKSRGESCYGPSVD